MSAHTDRLDSVLESWIDRHDIGDRPILLRHYLVLLLRQLWIEGEGFSGKRPFGNSGWKFDVYTSLVKNGHIVGTLDEDGDLATFDRHEADVLIRSCINRLNRRPE